MRAMILAAGRGERMRPLTDRCPKPLLPVGGKPLIAWHLEALAAAGFRDVVINHAHLGTMIEEALGDGSRWGLRLSWSPEDPALETAGGIARALPRLGAQPFLVVNGDVFCDFPFARARTIAAQMRAASLLAWCVLVPNPAHHPAGDFGLSGGCLEATPDATTTADAAVTPEPTGAPMTPEARGAPMRLEAASAAGRARSSWPLTFSGMGVYAPALFEGLSGDEPAKLAPLLRRAAAAGRCGAERHDGMWIDVGTAQRLAALDAQLRCRSLETL